MKFRTRYIVISIFLIFSGCIDPIEFDTGNEPPRLVVDGHISNRSLNERSQWPMNAEPFYVALRWSGPVNNERDEVISDASVELYSSDGTTIDFVWDSEELKYIMPLDDFHAIEGLEYFVRIELSNGEIYESSPERLYPAPEISATHVEYGVRAREIEVNGETEFVNQRLIKLFVDLPEHENSEPYYYRWRVIPSWVFEAPLPPSTSPVKRCYITSRYLYQKINVQVDNSGGYGFEVLALDTDDNEQIQTDFSALILQYSLSPDAYRFWEDISLQQQSTGGIFDPPPFPINSNIRNTNDPDERVSGFFSVAHVSATRWFINQFELPYNLQYVDFCAPIPGFSPPEECGNCLRYGGGGEITNQKPEWWREF